MGHRLVGEKTRLVPLEAESHFENLYRWMNDADVRDGLPTGDSPKSRPAGREWFEARQRGGEREAVWAVETLEGEHVGYTALYGIDFRQGSAGSGSMIDKAHWGKGYGTESAHLRAEFAFRTLGLRRIYSSHLATNEPSGRMQAAVGYVVWGRQPEAIWVDGEYIDHVFTMLTRDRWEEIRNTKCPSHAVPN